MKNNLIKNHGFTFVEILVSVTIFSIVSIAIYSSFYVGVQSWYKEKTLSKTDFENERFFMIISSRLENAVKTSIVRFMGKADELYFGAVLPYASDSEDSGGYVFSKVHFFLKNKTSDAKSLFRRETPLKNDINEEVLKPILMKEAVSSLLFEYPYLLSEDEKKDIQERNEADEKTSFETSVLDEYIVWKKTWQEPDKLPRAVRLTINFGDAENPIMLIKTVVILQGEFTSYDQSKETEDETEE